jgi:hypothetical protein
MTWMAALSLECVHGRSVHAAAHVALSAIRAITDAEGELFSHPNLGAEVPARAVPRSARAPTMARARRRSPSSPRRRDETPLKHGPRGKPAKCAVLRPAALLLNVLQISDVSHETPCNACVHVGRQRVPAKHEARQTEAVGIAVVIRRDRPGQRVVGHRTIVAIRCVILPPAVTRLAPGSESIGCDREAPASDDLHPRRRALRGRPATPDQCRRDAPIGPTPRQRIRARGVTRSAVDG